MSQSESSPVDLVEEDKFRTESWLLVVGGKKKGRIWGWRACS